MIDSGILLGFGAVLRQYKKGELILQEGAPAKFYYQLLSGEVKMYNTGDDGQEFIQGFFKAGDSFAEPPLFLNEKYPAAAAATTDCEVAVLNKQSLLQLLAAHFDVQIKFIETLSKRLYFKSMMAKEITMHNAAHRIVTLIDFLKLRDGQENKLYAVPLTRQEIANVLGLRVETVIRTIKQLIENKQLQQKGRKVYRGE